MDTPPAAASNRDLLWLIFGALMLIAGLQLVPISDRTLRAWIGYGSLAVAGIVFVARVAAWLLRQAMAELPAPLTGRERKEPSSRPQETAESRSKWLEP